MNYIDIRQRKTHGGSVVAFSSQLDVEHAAGNITRDDGFWSSQKTNTLGVDYLVVDYGEQVPVDFIEIHPGPSGRAAFPSDFRIEASVDGLEWRVLHSEKKYDLEAASFYMVELPVALVRFMKFFIQRPRKTGARYFSEIGRFIAGISGIKEISASTHSSYEHKAERLLDGDGQTFWESELRTSAAKEYVDVDLGKVMQLNRVCLVSAPMDISGFPENFSCSSSTDGSVWVPLFTVKNFTAQPSACYYWDIVITPARRLRLEMNTAPLENKMHGVRLSGIAVSAARMSMTHTHNMGELTPQASVFEAGVVRLAKDGETAQGAAVQGSDSRLRDASTIFKGIVQMAEDGSDGAGLVVQASDSRIKPASEFKPGTVRLAYDREDKPGAAVQGNDSRLKEASETSFGIVKLCPDALYSELSVVRGNDSRLHKATTGTYGICRLAINGEKSVGSAVQGNDDRLREGTTRSKGIVELAEDGEDAPGMAVQGNDRRLKEATTASKGIVELAEDGEDAPGVAVRGNDRRLKEATTVSKGIVELAEDGEDRPGMAVQGSDRRLKEATTVSKGIVELAEDGEDRPGVAVQGSDRRLKEATTVSKGIVELADDGEDAPGMAVQGSDRRLKEATTVSKGIVELAEDGEDAPGVAVRGNDRRLKEATTVSKGIVELADDGEDRPGVAVQGSDRRLKEASADSKGILRFAGDGESAPFAAVQGNDRRLKEATTVSKGIVELAEDGEDAPGMAVQGSDRRLKEATTASKGIVELAEDGEDRPRVAVQGNDRRLRDGTEDEPGILRLARDGEEKGGIAVQAHDMRLRDAREPLPHSHEYAPLVHEYSSHTGVIRVAGSAQEPFSGIAQPPGGAAVIYAENASPSRGAVGIAAVAKGGNDGARNCGVLGHGSFTGVRGQSIGNADDGPKGCGVLGISRFGAGGVFASEHSFSLVADGYGDTTAYEDTTHLVGNGDALLVRGATEHHGRITLYPLKRDSGMASNIVEMFEVEESEYIDTGDLLVVSDAGGSVLCRSTKRYSRSVVGVISANGSLVLSSHGDGRKLYPVVLTGRAMCRVDARQRPVKPGDLIVTSDTPGCGMAGDIDSFERIGTVIGKALDGLAGGIGEVPIFIARF